MAMICPCLWYQDAPAAIDWLTRAFGFELLFRVPAPDGAEADTHVPHAEMRLGDLVVMLGSLRPNDPLGMVSPAAAGGVTQCIYIGLDSGLDALFARAETAGAETVRALSHTDYGSREFAVRDPEGHLWCFGDYQPALQ